MLENAIYELSAQLGVTLTAQSWRVATAESCTGGGVAAAITAIAGSSQWFEYGVVSYSNQAKTALLKVPALLIDAQGAVSSKVVDAMVSGVMGLSDADIGVAISGIAGPLGGTEDKPVGTVWMAWAVKDQSIETQCFHFDGSRQQIQQAAVKAALVGLLERIPQ